MLLDHNLVEESPVQSYSKIDTDTIFVGTIIHHLYDERRVHLNEDPFNQPKRVIFESLDNNIFLYGYTFKPRGTDILLINKLKKCNNLDIFSYSKILEEFELSYTENILNLQPGVYPVDPVHIKKYMPNYTYQSITDFKEYISDFQQFTTIYMLLLLPTPSPINNIL